ncbi:MAG: pilin [Candidatus Saccharimonadales bacterium]
MRELLTYFAAQCDGSQTFFGLPAWYKYLDLEADPTGRGCRLSDAFSFPGDLGLVALAALEIALRLAGLVAIAFVIYGGFQFITSQGEPEASKQARQTIINAIIGLVIALFATVFVAFIGTRLAA